jgi:hypothetical protein
MTANGEIGGYGKRVIAFMVMSDFMKRYFVCS